MALLNEFCCPQSRLIASNGDKSSSLQPPGLLQKPAVWIRVCWCLYFSFSSLKYFHMHCQGGWAPIIWYLWQCKQQIKHPHWLPRHTPNPQACGLMYLQHVRKLNLFPFGLFGPQDCLELVEAGIVFLLYWELCLVSVQLPSEVCGLLCGRTPKGNEEPETVVAVLSSLCVCWKSFRSAFENSWEPLQKALRANTVDAKS